MDKKSYHKYIIASIGIFICVFSIWDIINTSRKDQQQDQLVNNLIKKIDEIKKADSANFVKLNSSLEPYNLQISGDTVRKINTTFIDNSIHVKSENQKGGQTAGSIVNH